MIVEFYEYAPDYIKKIIAEAGYTPKAYALFRLYDSPNVDKYPILRDRTEEMYLALQGMSGSNNVNSFTFKGHEMHSYGFQSNGPEFSQTFKVMWS